MPDGAAPGLALTWPMGLDRAGYQPARRYLE